MPAYHSQLKYTRSVGNMALMPLNSSMRGPALRSDSDTDIVSEALACFKSVVYFRTYDVKNDGDRTLIYLILYISDCLRRLQKCHGLSDAQNEMYNLAVSSFDLPGDRGFPLNALFVAPRSDGEAEEMRNYLLQLRQETGSRLSQAVFGNPSCAPKWWLCFSRRRFMDKSLTPI